MNEADWSVSIVLNIKSRLQAALDKKFCLQAQL